MFNKMMFIMLMVFSAASHADYLCGPGNNIAVHNGDSSSIVRLRCGDPISEKNVGVVKINGKDTSLEKWTYNPGQGALYKVFVFHNDALVEVVNHF